MKQIKMPNDNTLEKMEELLNVASDYTRLKILFCLLDGEKCVSSIQELIDASQSLVSHQLKVLKDAELVATRKDGTRVFYSLDDGHVKELISVVCEHATHIKD